MKKIMAGVLLLFTLAGISQAQEGKEAKTAYKGPGATLPALRIIDTSGKAYTNEVLKNEYPFFLILFNPTCDHCQKVGKLIGEHAGDFKNCKVVFMAVPATMPYLPFFYQETGIGNHPQIVIGVDSAAVVDRLFEYKSLPQINIYSKERKLVKTFYGDTPIDSLRKYVH